MSEHLPDPMPSNPADRERVQDMLDEAGRNEAAAQTWVLESIEAGRTPREILDQLGNEADYIIGPGAAADLRSIDDDAIDQAGHAAKFAENEVWVEILERLDRGESDRDLVEAFKDRGGLERLIGSDAAKLIVEKAKKEKTNG